MDEAIRTNIVTVLTEVRNLLKSDNVITYDLKRLSNHLIEDISLMHDRDSISISVMVYALYKIFSRNPTIAKKDLCKLLDNALKYVNREEVFRTKIKKVFDQIKKYDKNLGVTILQTIRHAQIKKGLKVYEHGLSIGQAAEIMGVSRWDILEYIGDFKIDDENVYGRIDARTRLNFTRGLFK